MTNLVRTICLVGILLVMFRGQLGEWIDVIPIIDPPQPQIIVGDGLHVLIVEETETRHQLPDSQRAILGSVRLRQWLADHGAQWRVEDQDDPQTYAEQKWRDAMQQPRASVPWLYATNGDKSISEPLPESVERTIEKLRGLIDG